MIEAIDDALRALVQRDALGGTDVDVVFDAPTKDWASRRNAPTVDVYLYDIREDLRRREVGSIDVRGEDGFVTHRTKVPRWFKLSYLVTAWTQRPEDEHRLLSLLLGCFLRHDRIPVDLIPERAGIGHYPVPLTIGVPPPEDRALSDTWSALGGELKPSLDLAVLAPYDLARQGHAGPPVMEGPVITLGDETVAARRAGSAADAAVEADAGSSVLAAEEVFGGGKEHPGRVVRFREMPRG